MSEKDLIDLNNCTEFSQTLLARPPRIVHGTTILLLLLIGAFLLWAAAAEADLVVCASGRIRPVVTPKKVFSNVRGAALSTQIGGRVAEVNFREGAEVKKGQLLIRLESEPLDNEVARRSRAIEVIAEETRMLEHRVELLTRQFETAKSKAEAELVQAHDEVTRRKTLRASEARVARTELYHARGKEVRARKLLRQGVVSEAEWRQAEVRSARPPKGWRRHE